jgi:hypothetical protein
VTWCDSFPRTREKYTQCRNPTAPVEATYRSSFAVSSGCGYYLKFFPAGARGSGARHEAKPVKLILVNVDVCDSCESEFSTTFRLGVGTQSFSSPNRWSKSVDASAGNGWEEADNVRLTTVTAVPAPPAVVLVGLGAGCIALKRYAGRRAVA